MNGNLGKKEKRQGHFIVRDYNCFIYIYNPNKQQTHGKQQTSTAKHTQSK